MYTVIQILTCVIVIGCNYSIIVPFLTGIATTGASDFKLCGNNSSRMWFRSIAGRGVWIKEHFEWIGKRCRSPFQPELLWSYELFWNKGQRWICMSSLSYQTSTLCLLGRGIWMGFGLVWRRVYFVLIDPALEQAFIAFYILSVYRSVEQSFLPVSVVYVGMVEYYSRRTMSYHIFYWDAWFIFQQKKKNPNVIVARVNETN